MYHESYIDTGTTINQSDSRLLDEDGLQVAYSKCVAGSDYPLFYPTTTNAHGKVLDAYFNKALTLGFDGICHGAILFFRGISLTNSHSLTLSLSLSLSCLFARPCLIIR